MPKHTPNFIAGLGITLLAIPLLQKTIYQNIFFAAGLFLLFTTWILANWEKGRFAKDTKERDKQKKILIGMTACGLVGLALLVYYEMQMPKYKVALLNEELYRVPPQLSKKQLLNLGAECNTYGNTLCSQAVFAKIVQLDPRDYQSLANLAMAQSHLGFHKQALVNFENAVRNGVNTFDVYKFYGHSQWAMGNKPLAKESYKKSLQLKPNQDILLQRIAE